MSRDPLRNPQASAVGRFKSQFRLVHESAMTPEQIIAAIRIGINSADRRFKSGGCFQLYRILKQLFPDAQAWYDPIAGHVYTRIDEGYYDIDGHHERGGKWFLLTDDCLLYAKAHEWDFV